jgi:primosomal protein N' (replication factor Y)
VLGVVLGRDAPTFEGALAPLAGVVDSPPIPPELIDLVGWTARYYRAPLAACLRLALPPGAEGTLRRRPDGTWALGRPPTGEGALWARAGESPAGSPRREAVRAVLVAAGGAMAAAELCRRAGTTMATLRRMAEEGALALAPAGAANPADAWAAAGEERPAPALTRAQAEALAAVEAALADGAPPGGRALLVHGVTGSGKTEVYLRAITAARAAGRGSLVLVPEIALTPQILGRLRARLGEGVAIWHSALGRSERAAEDRRIRAGEADVVLGARSAVFAPVPRLGLVIVDEEHDASYKQDATPRYDARQVAWRRARDAGAALVYGTATPRPETWAALPRVTLPERADGAPHPPVEVVDMRTQGPGPISRPLLRALHSVAGRGEKAIVLLNRRGLALMALCRECGWVARCADCDVALVLHSSPARLECHHCGAERAVPSVCPSCGSADLARQGSGTEGLERAIAAAVPDVRRVRMDAQTTDRAGGVPALLAEFARPGAAVLLGTQMVAKGHDLPGVALAAVVDADAALARPDFRAEERAFALIVQAAGRAGRRGAPGRVIVQAWEPAARAVRLAAALDVEGFLAGELERRRAHGYPPYAHLVRAVVDGERESEVAAAAGTVAEGARAAAGVRVLGPAPLHRLRGRWRRAILVAAERAGVAADALAGPARAVAAGGSPGLRVVIDVDPQET